MGTNGASGGCGCGGGCGGRGGGVAAAVVPSTATATGYVRPLFFAGQLLTEEDLELLGEYVTAKNRLYNRSFFGEGVVCGLEVLCHPCGEGKVLVRPGYALDCCGNDIVVPCETELDINHMVHRLRVEQLGGWDCGDPCDQPAKTPANGDGTGNGDGNDGNGAGFKLAPGKKLERGRRRIGRRYSLYVRYLEEVADPVAPYATDEPCGDEGCKPSRIREGYEFRLRCPEDRAEPDDFLARARKCYEAIVKLRGWGRRQSLWTVLGGRIPSALREFRAAEAGFTESDAQAMVKSGEALREFADRQEEEPDPDTVRRRLDDLRAVVMAASRFHALPEEKRRVALERFDDLAPAAEGAPEVAKLAAEAIGPHVDKAVDDPVERAMAHALIKEAPLFTDREEVLKSREDLRLFLAMQGTPMDRPTLESVETSLVDLKSWLLARLDRAELTDCRLRADVERIEVAAPTGGDIRRERLAMASDAGRALAAALIRYAYGCICKSLLPPCRPCDDLDVLLATVEVDDCEVVHVCNLDRRIPLTGNALAYWLPVEELVRMLDQACCEAPRRIAEWTPAPRPVEQPVEEPTEVDELQEGPATPAMWEVQTRDRPMFIRTTEEAREVGSIASMLTAAGLPPEQTERIAKTIGDVSALRSVRDFVPVAPMPEEAGAQPEAEREVADIADVAATAAAEAVERVTARRLEKLESRLKEFTAMKREVTLLRKRSDDQKQRNAELEKRNRALERRVEKLSGGG